MEDWINELNELAEERHQKNSRTDLLGRSEL